VQEQQQVENQGTAEIPSGQLVEQVNVEQVNIEQPAEQQLETATQSVEVEPQNQASSEVQTAYTADINPFRPLHQEAARYTNSNS
jgi:hypothetical protein